MSVQPNPRVLILQHDYALRAQLQKNAATRKCNIDNGIRISGGNCATQAHEHIIILQRSAQSVCIDRDCLTQAVQQQQLTSQSSRGADQ
ncbi:hypothetical protein TKK_0002193 [Trichogramma kaykai]